MKTAHRVVQLASIAAVVLFAGCRYQYPPQPNADPDAQQNVKEARQHRAPSVTLVVEKGAVAGTWASAADWPRDARRWGNHLWVTLKEGGNDSMGSHQRRTTMTMGVAPGDFDSSSGEFGDSVALILRRPAGALVFDGVRDGGYVKGDVRFEPDAAYAEDMTRLFAGPLTIQQTIQLFVANVKLDYIQGLRENGLGETTDEAIRLAQHGVTVAYVKTMKAAGAQTANDLIKLRNHGVSADLMRAMREPALPVAPKAEAEAPAPVEPRSYSVDDIIKLHNSGVRPDFIRGLQKAGYDLSIEDIIRLRNSGMTDTYIKGLVAAGCRYSPDEMIKLRNSGMTTDYISRLLKAGYTFTLDEMIKLRNSGMTTDYAAACVQPGLRNLTVDELIKLRNSGVSSDLVRQLRRPEKELKAAGG